jgi:hypothetical protein
MRASSKTLLRLFTISSSLPSKENLADNSILFYAFGIAKELNKMWLKPLDTLNLRLIVTTVVLSIVMDCAFMMAKVSNRISRK